MEHRYTEENARVWRAPSILLSLYSAASTFHILGGLVSIDEDQELLGSRPSVGKPLDACCPEFEMSNYAWYILRRKKNAVVTFLAIYANLSASIFIQVTTQCREYM